MGKDKGATIPIATNRKAFHDYEITEKLEAGLVLTGAEVKSLRQKEVSIEQSFVKVDNGEAFLYNLRINPYKFDTLHTSEPDRTRKLLLNRTELKRLSGQTAIKGSTVVPLEIYFRNGWAKVRLGVAKGKKAHDKRDSIKRKDISREMERNFKGTYKG